MGIKTVGAGCFFGGLVIGVVGTYLYLQNWVNDKIHEEIQDYREKKSEEKKTEKKEERAKRVVEDDEDEEYTRDYVSKDIHADVDKLVKDYSNKNREKGGYGSFIEVIPPLEFENFEENPKYENYKRVYLTYYYPQEEGGQGILAESETKELILDLRGTVGVHFADHFEDYESDEEDEEFGSNEACYIRNDKLKVFYEITKDLRTYKEAVGKDI